MSQKRKPVDKTDSTPSMPDEHDNDSNKRVLVDASASPPLSKYAGKFIFSAQLCRSLAFDEIWDIDESLGPAIEPDCNDPMDSSRKIEINVAPNVKMIAQKSCFSPACRFNRSSGEVPQWFGTTIIDWARTNSDFNCPLTLELFARPHILSCNGRSYSLDAILNAIKKTLQQGDPLPLGDMVLSPLDLDSIKLYPNYSLPGWCVRSKIEFSGSIDAEKLKFSIGRVKCDPTIANLFDGPEPNSVERIINAYRAKNNTYSSVVEDLDIKNAVFPRSCIPGDIQLRNVLFTDCVLHTCWRDFRLVGCHFKDCTIMVRSMTMARRDNLMNEFDSCVFVVQGSKLMDQEKGRVRRFVTALIQDSKPRFVKDCTFAVVKDDTFSHRYLIETPYETIKNKITEVFAPKAPDRLPTIL